MTDNIKHPNEDIMDEIMLKIADQNFKVFSLCSEEDVDFLKSIYRDKEKLRLNIRKMLFLEDELISLKQITKVEIFSLLTEFLFEKCQGISNIEFCTIYVIIHSIFSYSFKKFSKRQIFEFFKKEVIKHSLDRPPYQISILNKKTIEKLSDFFIENIYKRFEFLTYMTTKSVDIVIENKDLFHATLPPILDISMGEKSLPKKFKILKQYMDNRKPKSDLEQKIEIILDFEREKLDVLLEEKFFQQDKSFTEKVDDLISKKKK
jgi:hypothetical protein